MVQKQNRSTQDRTGRKVKYFPVPLYKSAEDVNIFIRQKVFCFSVVLTVLSFPLSAEDGQAHVLLVCPGEFKCPAVDGQYPELPVRRLEGWSLCYQETQGGGAVVPDGASAGQPQQNKEGKGPFTTVH